MRERQNQYPQLEVDLGKLQENLAALRERCQVSGIKLSGIVKGFCALPEAAKVYDRAGLDSIGSSRLEQLRTLRQAGIRTPLMMIRIPMPTEVDELVKWAEVSLQSEISVLRATNEAAARAGVRHKVILMVDLGDLREGFWDREELISAALEVEQKLENLDLLGVGTNLGCYGSVQATPEKMEELIAAAEAVEAAIGRRLEVISGGASSSVHMVLDGTMPSRINHLRVGELLLLGRVWGCDMPGGPAPMWTGATAAGPSWPWAGWTTGSVRTWSPGSRDSSCWGPPPTTPWWMCRTQSGIFRWATFWSLTCAMPRWYT